MQFHFEKLSAFGCLSYMVEAITHLRLQLLPPRDVIPLVHSMSHWRYVFHLKITKSLKMHIFKILFQDQFSRYMCFEDIYFPLKIHIPLSIYIFSRSYMSSFEDIYFGRYVVSKEEIDICFEAICFPLKIHIFIWRYITLFWRFKFSFDAIHFHFMIYILLWR